MSDSGNTGTSLLVPYFKVLAVNKDLTFKPRIFTNQNLLIHIGRSKEYIRQDILEEVFIHEGSHSSLDWAWDGVIDKTEWNKAAKKDKEYISKYAKKYPQSEDVAESIVAWIAVRYRLDRISNGHAEIILKTIPNRLQFFDEQNFDMYPLVPRE